MAAGDVEVLRGAWEAFSRGDVDGAVAALDPGIRWYPQGEPDAEGACHGREEAEAFLRHALEEGLTAELLDVRDAGDRLVAVIHTHAPREWERTPEPHGEVVTVRDGRITEMVIHPTAADALAAVGLQNG